MNILSMIVGRDGCSGYRVKNPLKSLEGEEHQVLFLEAKDSGDEILGKVVGADVIFFRQQHDQMFSYLKSSDIDLSNKLLVVDMDDDIFNITPFAETYRWGGVEEVKYEGKWLWKNGEAGFDADRNKDALQNVVNMLSLSDVITCTTPYLKKRLEEISGNKNVVVLPNAIDFNHWQKWPLKKGKEIRIGWTGGSTHYIDWYTIKSGLKRVFDKYDNLKLVLQGCKWDGTTKGIPHEFHNWIDFEGHPYKVASLNLDIAIIPLKDTLFNNSKSCIKWYEFSSLGVPSVVSNVVPYSTEIEHNKTALAYNNEDEFVEQLSRLIEDTKLRSTIGKNAEKWVKKNRDLNNIKDEYSKLFKKKMQVLNHGQINFVDITKLEKPEEHLKNVKRILDDSQAKWFLSFGTALGFYRDGDFIPGDSDIDVVVFADDFNYKELVDKFLKEYKHLRTVKDGDRDYQHCFQAEDGLIIDICLYYKDGDEYYTKAEGGDFRDKAEYIKPKMFETKYGSFPMPEKIEEYLTDRYDDWRTPKHGEIASSKKV